MQILRFENEAEELLHLFKAEGFEPGREGVIAETDAESVSVDFGGHDRDASRARSPRRSPSSPTRRRPSRTALPEQLVLVEGPLRAVR